MSLIFAAMAFFVETYNEVESWVDAHQVLSFGVIAVWLIWHSLNRIEARLKEIRIAIYQVRGLG